MNARKQSSTTFPVNFFMVLSVDHVSAATGKSPAVTLSKNGAAFGAAAGAVTEIANGWYSLAGNATDRNTLGELLIHATASGCDPVDFKIDVTAIDPFDSVLGLGALTIGTNNDKTGYALTSGEHTSISGTDVPTALIAQGYTSTRAGYLDTLNGLVAAIWAAASRTLTAFGFSVTVGTNNDKTGYALSGAEHTNIAADAQSGLTAQGYTTTRAPYLDKLISIGSGATFVNPVSATGTLVTIVRGDSYLAADGRSLDFPVSGFPSLAGGSILFTAKSDTTNVATQYSGVALSSTVARVELTAAQSGVLQSGTFDVQATLADGSIVTLVVGTLTVIADVTK